MSFEYLADPAMPAWVGILPGKPEPFFLHKGTVSMPSCSPTHSASCSASTRRAASGFERFFQEMGTLADRIDPDSPSFVPDFGRMQAAAQAHNMELMPAFDWPDD